MEVKNELDEWKDQIDRWRTDPVAFCYEALNVEYLTNQQIDILRDLGEFVYANSIQSLVEESEHIMNSRHFLKRQKRFERINEELEGVKLTEEQKAMIRKAGFMVSAGRDLGKSATVAFIAIWFLITFNRPQGYALAPTGQQAKAILMSEIDLWVNRRVENEETGAMEHAFIFRDLVQVTSERVFLKTNPLQCFIEIKRVPDNVSIEEQKSMLSGFHAEDQIFFIDEAIAFKPHIFNTINATNASPLNFLFGMFNPHNASSYACQAVFGSTSEIFISKRWNGEDSDKPGMKDTIKQRVIEYGGTDNDLYRVNVQGLPPEEGDDTTFPIVWMEESTLRIPTFGKSDNFYIGHDVSGEGQDDSTTAIFRGYDLTHLFVHPKITEYEQAAFLYGLYQDFNPATINIDTIGIGRAVHLLLKAKGCTVSTPVVVSKSPTRNPTKFYNLRAQGYWELRDKFKQRSISINLVEGKQHLNRLKSELSATRHKVNDRDQKIKFIPKSDIKKELGGRSPDVADCVMLAQIGRDFEKQLDVTQLGAKMDYYDRLFKRSRKNKFSNLSWMGR